MKNRNKEGLEKKLREEKEREMQKLFKREKKLFEAIERRHKIEYERELKVREM